MTKLEKLANEALKIAAKKTLPVEEHGRKDLTDIRKLTCKTCPSKMYDEESDKCKMCGCFIEIKSTLKRNRNPKAMMRVERTHCPMGHWGDKVVANIYRKMDGKELL